MRPFLLGLLAAATLATAAQARPYAVDKASSRIGFASSFGGEAFQGSFRRWDAVIDFDEKNLAASKAVVTVDLASASTGNEARDEALPSSDWFAAAKFPRATFATRSIRSLGGGRYQAVGDLTMRGVKRPVTLPFTLATNGKTARMAGRLTLDRTLWGVGQGQFRGGEAVPKAVAVTINVTAVAR